MLNRKFNKNLNLALVKGIQETGPFTPVDQTLSTPGDAPNINQYFGVTPAADSHGNYGYNPGSGQGGLFLGTPYLHNQNGYPQNHQPTHSGGNHNPAVAQPLYSHYNESDDMLMDEDSRLRNYTVTFTPHFDQLVLLIYSQIMAHPTTTPFSGTVPPSGMVLKVSNETMNVLMKTTAHSNHPVYDTSQVVNGDHLRSAAYHPVFLQLFRKRFLDLCTAQGSKTEAKLPAATSVSVAGGMPPLGSRHSLMSSLLLNELNIAPNASGTNEAILTQSLPQAASRSRSASLDLRKQSLTRNNSHLGSTWLHVGNLTSVRGQIAPEMAASTDSLQSVPDCVPQLLINRSGPAHHSHGSHAASAAANSTHIASTLLAGNYPGNHPTLTPNGSTSGFHAMMMDYHTPPGSHKGSVSSEYTPPSSALSLASSQWGSQTPHLVNPGLPSVPSDFEPAPLPQHRAAGNSFPRPLTINTESANSGHQLTLDSPFMSATTPSEEAGYFMNGGLLGFSLFLGAPLDEQREKEQREQRDQREPRRDVNLPPSVSLSEKKRDSLKLKRGIH